MLPLLFESSRMSCRQPSAIRLLAAMMIIVCVPAAAIAVSIHECLGSDGVVRYQDSPCLAGETSRIRILPGDPVHLMQAPAPAPANSTSETTIETRAPAPQPPLAPPSSTFLCQREDGTRYISDSGVGNRYAVPLGALGYPPMTLGEAYAGPNGIGVSAPGLRDVPVVRSLHGGAAGLYTWVEDPCSRVTGEPLCRFYADQLDDAQRQLRFAFSDTTAQVRGEIEDWQARVDACRY